MTDVHGGDFDDDSYDGSLCQNVQLGFIADSQVQYKHLFDGNFEDWDGGKIGGHPDWLDTNDIPNIDSLKCHNCGEPMRFLIQVYCPLDEFEDAFHRSLYVFCCRKSSCSSLGGLKCLRCQLPRENLFYSYVSSQNSPTPSSLRRPLCHVCGCRGDMRCGKCKIVTYCSKVHQKWDWSSHKKYCGSDTSDQESKFPTSPVKTFTFPSYDLVVEDEVLREISLEYDLKALGKEVVWEAPIVENEDAEADEDEALTQADYNAAAGNAKPDPVYDRFMDRVRKGGPDQVLRYSRWPSEEELAGGAGPLAISSKPEMPITSAECDSVATQSAALKEMVLGPASKVPCTDSGLRQAEADSVPNCQYCGAERKFEMQIMPQLLHYLHVDSKTRVRLPLAQLAVRDPTAAAATGLSAGQEGAMLPPAVPGEGMSSSAVSPWQNKTDEDLDWGTLDVYTCVQSCSSSRQSTGRVAVAAADDSGHKSTQTECAAYLEEVIIFRPPPLQHR